MTSRNRGVRGKGRVCRYQLKGAVKLHALAHTFATALKYKEGRVSFVDMPHGRRQTERAQGAHAADTQNDFLFQPHAAIAAIQLCRDIPVLLCIAGEVTVQQVQFYLSDLYFPDFQLQHMLVEVDVHAYLFAIGTQSRRHRQVFRIAVGILGELFPPAVDTLGEITLVVE